MGRKGIAVIVSVLTMFQPVGFIWAGQPRILSDLELDSIHAGGLNLDFDKMVGSASTTAQGMNKSSITPIKPTAPVQPSSVVNQKTSQTSAITPLNNASASLQRISSALNAYKTSKLTETAVPASTPVNSLPAPTAQQSSVASAPVPVEAAFSPALPNVAVDGASNITTLADATTPLLADPSVNTLANSLESMAGPAPTNAPTNIVAEPSPNITDPAVASAPVPETMNLASANAEAGPSPTSPTDTNLPQVAALPESSDSTNITADAVVNLDTKTGEWDGVISNADGQGGLTIFETSKGTMNVLNVTDTAQQNLNSMVNVNAAGSIVNVQLNTLVIMNSSIGSLTQSSNLDMSGLTAYSNAYTLK